MASPISDLFPTLTGRQEPHHLSVTAGDTSLGDKAIELKRRLGVESMPWQVTAQRVIMSTTAAGRWTHPTVCLICTRQNGKSEILIDRCLYGLFKLGETILYTAQRWKTARDAWKRMMALIQRRAWLHKHLKRATCSQGEGIIELDNGAAISFGTRSADTGRGLTDVALIIYDEAYNLTESEISAMAFTQMAADNPQRIYAGLGELLQRALGETIHIDVQLPQDSWCINVDRNQLENALLNLAINARDAMQGEGVIRITGENVILNPDDCIGKSIKPGEYVRLAVADTGVGMSEATLKRAFEPFFTTKREGHGTGLGLSMVFGFVRQSGGHVDMWSEEGKGSVVQMYFPHCLEPECFDDYSDADLQGGGQETILVVEDNEGVRLTVVELLQQSGYTVLIAEDGDRAMQVLQRGVSPDLIFTDVVMPGRVKSTDLATWARAQNPPVPVLFTSGHTRDILSSNHLLSADIHLLSKPYSPDALTQRVRRVLSARQGCP